tara:strand:- start:50 stop:538 length:489 start_codon:yes stop_codon:yes gene_type:complete
MAVKKTLTGIRNALKGVPKILKELEAKATRAKKASIRNERETIEDALAGDPLAPGRTGASLKGDIHIKVGKDRWNKYIKKASLSKDESRKEMIRKAVIFALGGAAGAANLGYEIGVADKPKPKPKPKPKSKRSGFKMEDYVKQTPPTAREKAAKRAAKKKGK